MLDYPWANLEDNDEQRETKCKNFASQLEDAIHEGMKTLGYRWFNYLKGYLNCEWSWSGKYESGGRWDNKRASLPKLTLEENRLRAALYIGDIAQLPSNSITTREVLRLEIAFHLIMIAEEWKDLDANLKKRVTTMVEAWKQCEAEEIRRIGYELEKARSK